MTRLRVVMLIESLAGGGAEAFAGALATGLDPDRFDVTVCVTREISPESTGHLTDSGVRIVRLGRSGRYDLRAWLPLLTILRQERVHVLHGHMFGSNVWASLLGRLAKVPAIVATEHSWSYVGQPLRKLIDGAVIGRLASVFVAVSEEDARKMVDVERVPRNKVRVIETCLPTGDGVVPARPSDARTRLGLPSDGPVVVSVASLSRVKRHDLLVRAIAQVQATIPDVVVALAGGGPEEATLRALVAELGLRERVAFLGHRDDVAQVLAAGDVFVLASDNEGSPLALIEAMHAGCPAVVTAVGGMPAMLEHGRLGRLVARGDHESLARAIIDVLERPVEARAVAVRAQAAARQRFSLARAVEDWERLYCELAGDGAVAGA